VRDLLVRAMDAHAPPAKPLEERIAAAGRLVDRLFTTTDRDERGQLRTLAASLALDERLPLGVRDKLWLAGMVNEPIVAAPTPITLDEKITAGRRLIQQLQATHDATQREHLRGLLGRMANIAGLDAPTRLEFQEAATSDAPPIIPPSWTPAPTAPEESRDRDVAFHDAYWAMARALAFDRFRTSAPTDEQIAASAAAHKLIAELPEQSADAVLAYHRQIEQVKTTAIVPAPRPRRRRIPGSARSAAAAKSSE
jgi:hypothetical protein